MDEDCNVDLFDRKELRKKKDKKRQHKEKENLAKENFKKLKEELDELRKKESERDKELEELKKKIEENELTQHPSTSIQYALGFDKSVYLSKGFIESAQWVKNVIAKQMIEKMNEDDFKERFAVFIVSKDSSVYLGYRACARFNRNEECNLGKWHLTHKPDGLWTRQRRAPDHAPERENGEHRQHRRNEIRLHVCTLCLEALGSAIGHCILDCPWILEKNWKKN